MENYDTPVNHGGYDQMSFDTNLVDDQTNLEHMHSPVRDNIDKIPNDRDSPKIVEDPYVGMSFESIKDVEELYYTFAGQKGFTVRKWSTKHSKQGLRKKTYVCSKHGKSRAKIPVVDNLAEKKTKPRHIRNPRTECKALLTIKILGEKWVVSIFNNNHNHDMATPSKKRFLKINRSITPFARNLIHNLEATNIPPSQQYSYVAMQSGGFSNCSFTRSDFNNFRKTGKEILVSHDVDSLIQKLKQLKEEDHNYYYSYILDDEGSLRHLFWADSRCIAEYAKYGEAVTFDTTYNTNKYKLIIGFFCGVNNHLRTVLFGSGFITNESTESFIWLFSEFKKCMGRTPKTIITDQDAAMKTALSIEFPDTFHRLCKWHITHKMCDKVRTVYRNKEEMERFNSILNTSDTIEQFENDWHKWTEDNNEANNKWLEDMFAIRERWCPIYMTEQFFGGMQSTQRSEGMNALVKMNVKRSSTLFEFVCALELVLTSQRNKLDELDHRDRDAPPHIITALTIECSLHSIYTTEVFLLFQQQVQKSMIYYIRVNPQDSMEFSVMCMFTQVECAKIHCPHEEGTPVCSCRMFSSKAIPCRHVIAFLTSHGRTSMPNEFICDRWKMTPYTNIEQINVEKQRLKALNDVFNRCSRIILAKCDIQDTLIAGMDMFLNDFEQIHSILIEPGIARSITRFEERITSPPVVGNPKIAKTKSSGKNMGRPSKADPRFKSTKEIVIKRPRACKKCNEPGHDSRNCAKQYYK